MGFRKIKSIEEIIPSDHMIESGHQKDKSLTDSKQNKPDVKSQKSPENNQKHLKKAEEKEKIFYESSIHNGENSSNVNNSKSNNSNNFRIVKSNIKVEDLHNIQN